MIEIERKFLVKPIDFASIAQNQHHITQGYLNSSPERTVRVRLKDLQGFLTIKGTSIDCGLSRFEWEKEIDFEDAKALVSLCEPVIIEKIRYIILHQNHTWEVDVFGGAHKGLMMAEIELSTIDEVFALPDWVTTEVTGDERYYNAYLSKHGINSNMFQ